MILKQLQNLERLETVFFPELKKTVIVYYDCKVTDWDTDTIVRHELHPKVVDAEFSVRWGFDESDWRDPRESRRYTWRTNFGPRENPFNFLIRLVRQYETGHIYERLRARLIGWPKRQW